MNRPKKPGQISRPTGLHAFATSHKVVHLTWQAAPDMAGVTGYLVDRREPGSSRNDEFSQIGCTAVAAFTDSRLFSNSSYEYRIRATTLDGISAYSAVAKATTAKAPTALKKLALDVQAKLAPELATLVFTGKWCDLSQASLDDRCLIAAIKAGLSLSLKKVTHAVYGRGWDFDTNLVLAGYEAAKAALSKHDAAGGPLDRWLFIAATIEIRNEATEQSNVFSWRNHDSTKPKPGAVIPVIGVAESELGSTEPDSQELVKADAEQLLKLLDPANAELLTSYYHADKTLAEIGAEYGYSTATAERKVKRAIAQVRSMSQICVDSSVH